VAGRLGPATAAVVLSKPARPLPQSAVLGFALGSLGAGVYSTVPTVLLLFYCTETLGISPAVAATIVFVPKAWAIMWDPIVGTWSDRLRSSKGRRAPFILKGSLGVAVSFALLFNIPATSDTLTVTLVMLIYFAMASAYSLFAVPYIAVPAEISTHAPERERLMAWRMGFAMVGVLLGAGVAPHIVSAAGGGRQGYGVMAVVIAAACGLAMLVTWVTVRRHHVRDRVSEPLGLDFRSGLRLVLANRDYVLLWFIYLLAMTGASMFTAMVPYFVTRVLGQSEGNTGTMLIALLGGTIASLPLWAAAMRRWGGWPMLAVAMIVYGVVAGLFGLVQGSSSIGLVAPLFIVLGVPFAGLQLLPFVLLVHIAHEDARSGVRQEGLFTGIWTAGEKLALAIGPALRIRCRGRNPVGRISGRPADGDGAGPGDVSAARIATPDPPIRCWWPLQDNRLIEEY